jgi:hypothetical protein
MAKRLNKTSLAEPYVEIRLNSKWSAVRLEVQHGSSRLFDTGPGGEGWPTPNAVVVSSLKKPSRKAIEEGEQLKSKTCYGDKVANSVRFSRQWLSRWWWCRLWHRNPQCYIYHVSSSFKVQRKARAIQKEIFLSSVIHPVVRNTSTEVYHHHFLFCFSMLIFY